MNQKSAMMKNLKNPDGDEMGEDGKGVDLLQDYSIFPSLICESNKNVNNEPTKPGRRGPLE